MVWKARWYQAYTKQQWRSSSWVLQHYVRKAKGSVQPLDSGYNQIYPVSYNISIHGFSILLTIYFCRDERETEMDMTWFLLMQCTRPTMQVGSATPATRTVKQSELLLSLRSVTCEYYLFPCFCGYIIFFDCSAFDIFDNAKVGMKAMQVCLSSQQCW